MTGYRLSRRAARSLEQIFGWTLDHFGRDQAVSYKDDLKNRLQALDAGVPPHGRSCGLLVAGSHDVADLMFYREGRHFIIYRSTDDGLFVIDFIHGARDLESLLQALVATGPTDDEA